MASSSPAPARPSRYPRANSRLSSPPNNSIIEFLSPDRHSEKSHKDAIAMADAMHTQIRDRANQVLIMHEEKTKYDELVERARLEAERLRIHEESIRLTDESIAAEKKRIQAEEAARERQRQLRELQAKKVAPLSPVATQTAQPPAPAAKPAAPTPSAPTPNDAPAPINGASNLKPAAPSLFPTPAKKAPSATTAPTPVPAAAAAPAAVTVAVPVPTVAAPAPATPSTTDPKKQRALVIHKNLKDLRRSINDVQVKQNPALKSQAGDLRREIRKSVGQFSFEKEGNKRAMAKITEVLKKGLANNANSQLIDPSHFLFEERQPVNGAANNNQLPSLFLFLINHLAKAVIKQFTDESSANTRTADPIGIMVASTFSDPALLWRGKPLIDILMAKFYIVCPVLFGARGLEKSEAGRERVGWQRRGTSWVPETEHYSRQTGLGAGFAAISLRDFSKSKKDNPYPMAHYWAAMAHIVNTPPSEMSNTSCYVLKAMIEHYEQRFLLFYGTAAVAALRLALVDFPNNAKANGCGDVAVESLSVHARTLQSKFGLPLA